MTSKTARTIRLHTTACVDAQRREGVGVSGVELLSDLSATNLHHVNCLKRAVGKVGSHVRPSRACRE